MPFTKIIKKNIVISAIILLFALLSWRSQVFTVLPFAYKTWKLPIASNAIAFSSDGKMLATGAGKAKSYMVNSYHSTGKQSSTVEIRNVSNGSAIQTLKFPAATSLAFSYDDSLIATANSAGEINIWRISDGKLIKSLKHYDYVSSPTPVTLLAFTPNGKTLVSFSKKIAMEKNDTNRVRVWNIDRENSNYTLDKFISCSAISPDGKLLAIGGQNDRGQKETLSIFQLDNGNLFRKLNEKQSRCLDLHFGTDSKSLIFTGSNEINNTNIYEVNSGNLVNTITTSSATKKFLISNSTNAVLGSDGKNYVFAYDVTSFGGDVLFPKIYKALFGRIRVWNLENGKLVHTFLNSKYGSNDLAISPDGTIIASAEKNNTIRLWRIPDNNYRWLWLLSAGGLAAIIYWQRNKIMSWLNR